MQISPQSIKNFTVINGFIFMMAGFQYTVSAYLDTFGFIPMCCTAYVLLLVRNYALLRFIEHGTDNKPFIAPNSIVQEKYPYELHTNVLTSTAVEAVTHIAITLTILDLTVPSRILYFIPVSFLFEFILDFFHYCGHRLLHHKWIYSYFHKKHHMFAHPRPITTFYQDPVDLIVTISVPTVLSLLLIPTVSYFEFQLLMVYKMFSEISGHTGKILSPTGCFPQCIWLPRQLSIELYTEDHDLHHSLNNCNYAKRFSFWDKVFGTYNSCKR